jgi:hypothetical protein
MLGQGILNFLSGHTFRTVAWFDIYLLNDEFGPALQLVVDKTVVSSPFAQSRLRTQEEKWRQ